MVLGGDLRRLVVCLLVLNCVMEWMKKMKYEGVKRMFRIMMMGVFGFGSVWVSILKRR